MKVEAPFIHLIKLHTKYYLYDVNSKMIVNISNDLFDFFKSNENIKAEIEIPLILSILVDTFISKISFPMQPGPEIGSISDA